MTRAQAVAVVSGLEALKRRVRVRVHCPEAQDVAENPGEANPDLLGRFAAQRERHDLIWAPEAEPPNGDDRDRAWDLAVQSCERAAQDAEAERERNEAPQGGTIEQALEMFLAEQRESVSKRTFANYESVISLLRNSLNGYAYQGLDDDESARFDAAYDRHSDGGAFCRVFGPQKIPENIGEFLGYYMARKVITTSAVLQATGPVVRKFGEWLTTRDYGITAADVEDMLVEEGWEIYVEADLVDGEWQVSMIGTVYT
ncbi:hypothetical protein ETD83_37305 [Actinomadura soli]|uniref:Uncharacterized protein n=1 Tax=Actinomadura soli TaxID=2508997 RepID=A0A5C4J3D6_9ACTN|nr:hypothetical protein [Actinomadura soli]TMQ90017.1 hypothetical protein ETD83_37305 [Actinomadura soli]